MTLEARVVALAQAVGDDRLRKIARGTAVYPDKTN